VNIQEEMAKKQKEFDEQGINRRADFLAIRPDIMKILEKLKENTVVHKEAEWAEQIEANMPYLLSSSSMGELEFSGSNKTAIIVGASPALKKNVDALKDIEGEYRKEFILFVVNSAAKYCLDSGVKPDYIVAVDCDELLWDRDFSNFNREDLTLICSPFLHPKVIKNWKGKIYFVPMGCKDIEVQEKVRKTLGAVQTIPGCGNAYNETVFLAYNIFHCHNFVFVGNELSWKKEEHYYVDGKQSNDFEDDHISKHLAIDIFGKPVVTTPGHWIFKTWIENMASVAPGTFINASEGGILGVTREDGILPFIKQMNLKGAIALIKRVIKDSKDWRFVEVAKYNLAWHDGYRTYDVPFIDEIDKLGAKNLLDVGCGDGTAVNLLNWFGYNAYGIDISPVAANRWNGVADRCVLAFADDIRCEDDCFDLATTDILEHVPVDHVRDTIKEISRVSKHQMFYMDYKPSKYKIRNSVEPHATIRPPQWWRKEFRRCGLKIESTPGHRTFITRRK